MWGLHLICTIPGAITIGVNCIQHLIKRLTWWHTTIALKVNLVDCVGDESVGECRPAERVKENMDERSGTIAYDCHMSAFICDFKGVHKLLTKCFDLLKIWLTDLSRIL